MKAAMILVYEKWSSNIVTHALTSQIIIIQAAYWNLRVMLL